MTKKLIIVALIFIIILNILNMQVYAYWDTYYTSKDIQVLIGDWVWDQKIIPDEWNLNIWEDEGNLNQTIPENQLFSYNGLLYVVRDGEEYNPHWHGLPGNGGNQWAYVSLELEWRPNMNYRVNSVVIRDGRWFIANPNYNSADWFVNDPLSKSGTQWSEWREIEPLDESYFGYLIEYPALKDYRADISDVIFV
jgi:hypothetical protein